MKPEQSGYITIKQNEDYLYGGDQNLFSEKRLKGYGCGVIAASDVSIFLRDCPNTFEWDQYQDYVKKIEKYFFYLPYFGMSGWALSLGINKVFREYRLPYHARWRLLPLRESSKYKIRNMLDNHFPVIISIGPNFPNIFGKKSISLYRKSPKGNYYVNGKVQNHFVVVTEYEDQEKLKVSSWGKTYYIDWEEYLEYSRKNSMPLFTNYLEIKRSGIPFGTDD